MKSTVIDCPHCGNEIRVRLGDENKKCRWCRRLLKIEVKHLGGKRYDFTAIPIDFPPKPEIKSYNQYKKEDIFGT